MQSAGSLILLTTGTDNCLLPNGIFLQPQFKSLLKSEFRLQLEHAFILWEDGPEMVKLLLEYVWTPREPRAEPYHLFGLKRGGRSSTHIAAGTRRQHHKGAKQRAASVIPGLQPAGGVQSWRGARRCRCWWQSGQRDTPCDGACSGRSCTRCESNLSWWVCAHSHQTHCSRLGRTEILSTELPAQALWKLDTCLAG